MIVQVQKNKRASADSADLLQLIMHVEIKDHRSSQLQWSFKHAFLAVLAIIVMLSHGACCAPMLRSLSMRVSNLGTKLSAVENVTQTHRGAFALRTPSVGRCGGGDMNRMTLMIDLDHTSIYGNDGNDLGLALQWVRKDHFALDELYQNLVNPHLRAMYDSYKAQGKHINVVIYTRRPGILYHRSEHYGQHVKMQYESQFHADEQIYLPSSVAALSDLWATYRGPDLPDHEAFDAQCALARLLAARNAIAHELGLDVPPPVVVTAHSKKVEATARRLQLPVESAILFDDNAALKGDPRVVIVDKMTTMPKDRRAEVLALMQREAPAESLDVDLVEFLMTAPLADRSLMRSGSGQLSWHVALSSFSSTLMPWPTPDPLMGLTPRGKHAAAADVSCKLKRAAGEEHLELEQQISDCSDSPLAY